MYSILIMSFVIVGLVYLLFFFMNYKLGTDEESSSAYECGFDVYSLTRMGFSYRFFLISILFLIFDVEISLMLPIPFLIKSEMSMWVFYIFIIVLLLGLLYEYYCGSLEWLNNFISKA